MEWSNNGQDGPTDNPWKATEQRPEFHKQEDAHNTKQDNGPEKRVKSQPENNQDNIAGDREIGESGSHVRTEQRNNRIQREDIENESQDPAKNKKEHVLGGETQLKDGGNINAGGMSADKRKAQSPLPEQVPQRSSLDDLKKWPTFRTWRRDDPSGASQISLPSSGSSSIVPSSSLALEQLPLGQSLEQLMVRPENVPLPKPVTRRKTTQQSTEGPRNKNKKKSKKVPPQPHPQLTAAPEVLAYRTDVNLLAGHFSNLRNIAAAETRYDWSTRIVFYDHIPSESDRPRRQEPWKSRAFAPLYQEFYSTLRNVPDDCVQRIILVEDLTPSLIDLLGATFQIPPHVFEEHLDRSGYGKRLEVQSGASAWHTRSSTQGYSSITWYRPVLPLVPMTSKFRKRLILNEKPIVPCIFDGCGHHNLRLSALANIWRHHLELCPDPGVHHKGTQSEYPVGWEERATIWTQDFDNCKFGMLCPTCS